MQHPLQIASRCDPTNAQAGRQSFGERAAQQHTAVFIEGFDGARAWVAVGQLAIHIVFDNRHVKALGQGQQGAFARFRHDVAQGVVAVWGELDDFDRPLFQRQFQGLQADAGERVGGDFQGFHAQALEGLHGAVEAGRIHRDDIAGLTNGVNAGGEGFVATGGDHDVFGAQLAAGVQ